MRRLLAAGLGALVLGAAALAALAHYALAPVGGAGEEIVVEVPLGASLGRTAALLETAGAIRSALAFESLARLRGQAEALRAGEYAFPPDLDARGVLERLVSGAVRTHRVAIPEGLRLEEVAARFEAAGLASAAELVALARDPATVRALGAEGESLEGYLFPETYELAKGLPAREIVRMMVEHFFAAWRPLEAAAAARGLTRHEVVVLASLVEKETGAPVERPLVAAVFLNRLARGMRLETDPAVIYGIADFDGNLRRVHLEDESNAYNTYRHAGLPPGPIANPGAASLRAVVEPADAEYLFFVARNDGTHHFSRTYGEHVRAVNRFQRGGR